MINDPSETDSSPNPHHNKRGTKGHYSSEEYDSQAEDTPRYVEVGVSRGNRPADPNSLHANRGEDFPSDVGRRAYVDEKTGEVYGSGAGGGTETEDYDHDTSGGRNNDVAAQ